MPDTRTTLDDLDRDIAELRVKQIKARAAGEDDYVVVLTAALNRALSERFESTEGPCQRSAS
jgi:hypothetical protein